MAADKQRKTFLSYSRINKDFAIKLAKELKSEGFDIWLDQLDIPAGSRWDREVEKALRESEIFMIILTPASVDSENVLDEIGYAIDNTKRFLPVLLEKCDVPLRLRRFQYVDFTNKSFDDGVESAKDLLRNLIAQPTIPQGVFTGAQVQAETERKAKEEADRLAALQAEEERLAKEKTDLERRVKEEAERLYAQKAEEERQAKAKADAERKAKTEARRKAKEEADRLAAQKAEEERLAIQKAEEEFAQNAKVERERKEKEDRETKAEAERLAVQKAEEERSVRQMAEEELAAKARAEKEHKAKEEAERLAAQKIEEDRLAKQKTEEELAAKAKTEADRLAAQKFEEQRLVRQQEEVIAAKAKAERLAAQKAEEERLAKQQAEEELTAKARAKEVADRLAIQKAEEDRVAKTNNAVKETSASIKTPVSNAVKPKSVIKWPLIGAVVVAFFVIGSLALVLLVRLGSRTSTLQPTSTFAPISTTTQVVRILETPSVPSSTPTLFPTPTVKVFDLTSVADSPQALLSQAKTWNLQLSESFDDNKNGWDLTPYNDEVANNFFEITKGKFRWTDAAKQGHLVYSYLPLKTQPKQFFLTVEAEELEHKYGEYGFIWQSASSVSQYYYFGITPPSKEYFFYMWHRKEWNEMVPYTSYSGIKSDSANELTLIVIDSDFYFYINDEFVAQSSDNTLKNGRIALVVGLSEDQSTFFEFDNLELRTP